MARSGSRSRRGYTLLELAVTTGLFAALLVVTAALFTQTMRFWRSSSSSDTANRELRKARGALARDLALASAAQLDRGPVPSSLGGADDGEALWFLSPVDPNSGQAAHLQAGGPFWQRNVLYYLVVPANHDATFGMSCTGTPDGASGYESACGHKVLVRKQIDSGPATDATDEASIETLLPDVAVYMTRPNGFDTSGMLAEPGLEDVEIVASYLLHFESATGGIPNAVDIDLRAVALEDAQKEISLGSISVLMMERFTRHAPFSAFLQN